MLKSVEQEWVTNRFLLLIIVMLATASCGGQRALAPSEHVTAQPFTAQGRGTQRVDLQRVRNNASGLTQNTCANDPQFQSVMDCSIEPGSSATFAAAIAVGNSVYALGDTRCPTAVPTGSYQEFGTGFTSLSFNRTSITGHYCRRMEPINVTIAAPGTAIRGNQDVWNLSDNVTCTSPDPNGNCTGQYAYPESEWTTTEAVIIVPCDGKVSEYCTPPPSSKPSVTPSPTLTPGIIIQETTTGVTVSGTTTPWTIGKQLNLQVAPNNPKVTLTNVSYTVFGSQDHNADTLANAGYSDIVSGTPNVPASSQVTLLYAETPKPPPNLLQFFFVAPGNNFYVGASASATLGNTSQTVQTLAFYNIKAPSVSSCTPTEKTKPQVVRNFEGNTGDTRYSFGKVAVQGVIVAGISCTYSVTSLPANLTGPQIAVMQLIRSAAQASYFNAGSNTPGDTGGAYVADYNFALLPTNLLYPTSATTAANYNDSPNQPLVLITPSPKTQMSNFGRVDTFHTFLTFKPGAESDKTTSWVSLGRFDWSWRGNATCSKPGVSWTGSGDADSADATEYPTYQQATYGFPYQRVGFPTPRPSSTPVPACV